MFKRHLNLPGNTQRLAVYVYVYSIAIPTNEIFHMSFVPRSHPWSNSSLRASNVTRPLEKMRLQRLCMPISWERLQWVGGCGFPHWERKPWWGYVTNWGPQSIVHMKRPDLNQYDHKLRGLTCARNFVFFSPSYLCTANRHLDESSLRNGGWV